MDEGDISQNVVGKFYDAVREFYETAYTYCVKWLPLDDLLYKCRRLIEFSNRSKVSFNELTELLTSFPRRFDNYIKDPHQLDDLEEEYQQYETMSDNDIPKEIWEESLVKIWEGRSYWMDIIWSEIKKITPEIGEYRIISFNHPTQQCQRRTNLQYHREQQDKISIKP